MAVRPKREEPFIRLLLSAFENGLWADASLDKPRAIDRTNPSVDQVASRKCDGKKLVIEHTIKERFSALSRCQRKLLITNQVRRLGDDSG
jgi:hypothetical protein